MSECKDTTCCAESRQERIRRAAAIAAAREKGEELPKPQIRDRMQETAERMAMCLTCPRPCPIGDRDARMQRRLQDPEAFCPEGRWPDAAGLVQLTVSWEGVPFTVRVRRGLSQAWIVFRQHIGEDKLYRGCGCIRMLMWAKPLLPWGKRGWIRRIQSRLPAARAAWRHWRRELVCPAHSPLGPRGALIVLACARMVRACLPTSPKRVRAAANRTRSARTSTAATTRRSSGTSPMASSPEAPRPATPSPVTPSSCVTSGSFTCSSGASAAGANQRSTPKS
jgi:hypothetical protein